MMTELSIHSPFSPAPGIPANTMLVPGVMMILLMLVLLGLAIFWAIKSRTGRWVVGILGGLFFLAVVPAFYLVRVEQSPARIATSNDFQVWQHNQSIQSVAIESPMPPVAPRNPGLAEPPAPAPSRPPSPPIPTQGWVLNNAGAQRITQSTGRVTFDLDIPGPDGSLAGYSGIVATPEEALKDARSNLSQKVKALVKLEVARSSQDPSDPAMSKIIDSVVGKYLEQPGVEAERFQEPVRLPETGLEVHRAAVLTILPKDEIPRLTSDVLQMAQAKNSEALEARRSGAWTVGSVLVLALFIYIIYSFINAGTKGHLAWPLRLISVTAFLLLVTGLLIVRGHLP